MMKSTTKITLAVFLIVLHWASYSSAQSEEDREKEPGFWELIFNDFFDDHEQVVHNNFKNHYRVIDLEKQWKFQIGTNNRWAEPRHDDQSWVNIKVPGDWENDGFHGYDGFAWYRIHFDGRILRQNEAHYLVLGFIDDVDETFLNGTLVGKTGDFPPRFRTGYDSNREYFIGNELINFDGDNVIAVKVYDEYKNGGIVKGEPGIYVSGGSEQLLQNLYGPWKFTKSNRRVFSEPDLDDDNWDIVLVPSYWDNQGYRSLDGTAWYRKTFELSFTPEESENYYLTLGRIDDFDITYLNGQKIGETDDGRDFGQSGSYQTLRVYSIPNGLLNEKGKNTIAVKVIDMGLEGGIYSGPIGIVSEEEVTRMIRNRK
ncbi:MAG: beta galactosidase jelly roll domain-containing protein [Reichenbachiella sp.]|uniref:beta galactosidase jelly roll domain-containing protein n=1 Tax=Reichenbachiella sp. TaxID=2184521 RepID=UPI0032984CF4